MRGELLEAELVHSIVGGFFDVYNYYGYGLNESSYAGALELELVDRGHEVVRELAVEVCYKGRHVTWQRLDMVVDHKVIVEVKATEQLSPGADSLALVIVDWAPCRPPRPIFANRLTPMLLSAGCCVTSSST